MNYKDLTDYMFTVCEKNNDSLNVVLCGDKVDFEFMNPKGTHTLTVMTKGDNIAWTIDGYNFEPKHTKSIIAFTESYNDREDAKFRLHTLFRERKLMIYGCEAGVDVAQATKTIDQALNFFTQSNQVTDAIDKLLNSAEERGLVIKQRVDELKKRACEHESKGDHKKAMRCLNEVCQKFYGYGHMELIAPLYSGRKTTWGVFPDNEEYALECLMIAVEKDETNLFSPLLAYRIAKKLGKTELCEKLVAIGQQRGTWNKCALRGEGEQLLNRIKNCYLKGVGCEANQEYAKYYERLLDSELSESEVQNVFKDMLTQGFEPVFDLMNGNKFFKIESLQDLDGLSEEFRDRFLYGNDTEGFNLPEWFECLVNGLNERDRDLVLGRVKAEFTAKMQALADKFASGDIELVNKDFTDGIFCEQHGQIKVIMVPDFEVLVSCKLGDEIRAMMNEFKKNI